MENVPLFVTTEWLAERLNDLNLTDFRKKSPILKECEGAKCIKS